MLTLRQQKQIVFFSATLSALVTIVVTRRVDKRSRRIRRIDRNPRFRRAAIIRPILSNLSTPWKQVLSAGSDDDFLVSQLYEISVPGKHITLFRAGATKKKLRQPLPV